MTEYELSLQQFFASVELAAKYLNDKNSVPDDFEEGDEIGGGTMDDCGVFQFSGGPNDDAIGSVYFENDKWEVEVMEHQ